MTNTPLNPDALEAAHRLYTGLWNDGANGVAAMKEAIQTYLAVAQPHTVQLVTIKLPKNPDHNPRAKLTNTCAVSPECTDSTGEHHTVAVYTDDEVDALRTRFGHITRIERVSITAAQPVVNSVEELDKLPMGTLLRDSDGDYLMVTQRFHYDERDEIPRFSCSDSASYSAEGLRNSLPATVLYTPKEQSWTPAKHAVLIRTPARP